MDEVRDVVEALVRVLANSHLRTMLRACSRTSLGRNYTANDCASVQSCSSSVKSVPFSDPLREAQGTPPYYLERIQTVWLEGLDLLFKHSTRIEVEIEEVTRRCLVLHE